MILQMISRWLSITILVGQEANGYRRGGPPKPEVDSVAEPVGIDEARHPKVAMGFIPQVER